MKKSLSADLKKIASILPVKWEKQFETIVMSGSDANLCFSGSKRPYRNDQLVEFKSPVFVLVNHHRKLKEGVKKYGPRFVKQYINQF